MATVSPEVIESLKQHVRQHKPSNFLENRRVSVIGNFRNFQTGVYGKLVTLVGLEAVPAAETTERPLFALTWKNGILSDRWGWSFESVAQETADLRSRFPGLRILNEGDFRDDKSILQEQFKKHFGYALDVDPREYHGLAVCKSRGQATHDGRVVQCPIDEVDEKAVYQIVVDNQVGDMIEDLRVSIIGNQIPVVYAKYRPLADRFANQNSYCKLLAPTDALSLGEIANIKSFCASIHLEFGEVDVLRARASGKIFIVDANNTPHGPPNLEPGEAEIALRLMANALLPQALGS